MKNVVLYMILVLAIVGLYGFAFSVSMGTESEGEKIFLANKCNTCHTVEALEITSKKKDALDISTIGTELNAEFFTLYLTKEKKIDGKEHKVVFKGSKEDLQKLSLWLESLKGEKQLEEIQENEN